MSTRALISPKGETFAYLQGTQLYTLEGVLTGRLEGEFVVDLAGRPVWRVRGDGVYALNGLETIGFFGMPRPDKYEW